MHWSTLLRPLLRGKGKDLCEIKASLVFMVNSRTARATQRDPVSGKTTTTTTTTKKQIT